MRTEAGAEVPKVPEVADVSRVVGAVGVGAIINTLEKHDCGNVPMFL